MILIRKLLISVLNSSSSKMSSPHTVFHLQNIFPHVLPRFLPHVNKTVLTPCYVSFFFHFINRVCNHITAHNDSQERCCGQTGREASFAFLQANRVEWGMEGPDRDDGGNSEHDCFKAYLIHRLLLTCHRSTGSSNSIDFLHLLTQRTQFLV